MAEFYAPQFNPSPDILGSYIRGQMAPMQVQAAQQQNTLGGLQIDQLRQTLQRQQQMNGFIDQLVGQGTQGAGAQNPASSGGGIQNGPQGAVSAPTQPSGSYDGSVGGFQPSTLTALALLRGDDPLKTAEGIQTYQQKQRQLQAQGPLALADTVSTSANADQLIRNNPSLQQQWVQIAPQLGLDPFKDLTPENARKAAIFGYNNLAGAVGLPPKAMPVELQTKTNPDGSVTQTNPVTGKIEEAVKPDLKAVIGDDGRPVLLPSAQAAGKQPFNQSIFGAANITDQQKELAYQTYITTGGKLPSGMMPRSDAAKSELMGYIAKRAAAEGNTAVSIAANGQATQATQGVVNDFTKGQSAKTLNGLNTAITHMDILQQAAGALGNGNIQALNKMSNFFGQQFGGTAANNFNVVRDFAAGEVAKAVLPGGGGEKEREDIANAIKSSSSPQQLAQAIGEWRQLLAGKTEALRNQWDVGTRGTQGSFDKFLLPATKKALGITDQTAPTGPIGVGQSQNVGGFKITRVN